MLNRPKITPEDTLDIYEYFLLELLRLKKIDRPLINLIADTFRRVDKRDAGILSKKDLIDAGMHAFELGIYVDDDGKGGREEEEEELMKATSEEVAEHPDDAEIGPVSSSGGKTVALYKHLVITLLT